MSELISDNDKCEACEQEAGVLRRYTLTAHTYGPGCRAQAEMERCATCNTWIDAGASCPTCRAQGKQQEPESATIPGDKPLDGWRWPMGKPLPAPQAEPAKSEDFGAKVDRLLYDPASGPPAPDTIPAQSEPGPSQEALAAVIADVVAGRGVGRPMSAEEFGSWLRNLPAPTSPESPSPEPCGWQPIETAPKMRKILVFYRNSQGKGRVVLACYYREKALEMQDDYSDVGEWDEESGTCFADAGWYEEHDSDNPLMPLQAPPTHWQPLPQPPEGTKR